MLNDRDMALDALEAAKVGATELTKAASESSNPALRQALLQMRSQCEQAQQQLGQMAISNNWYLPAQPADHQEVTKVLQFFQRGPDAPPIDPRMNSPEMRI